MMKDNQISPPFASISSKKMSADFAGGTVTSDGGVLFLREVERGVGVIRRLVGALTDNRHQSYIDHSYDELVSQRVYQIACGYEDANDCNDLRTDPAIKAACGRLPITGGNLASQSTMTRLENSVTRTQLYRMAQALVDTFLCSYKKPPGAIILDMDDTDDSTHGTQQMSLFNAYHDEYCYMPIHVYEGRSGKLITTILRPGKRPSGSEITTILTHLVPYIKRHWPTVQIIVRADSHFSTPEVHEWCEENDLHYALGQSGNAVLREKAASLLAQAQSLYELTQRKVRMFTSFSYQAGTWSKPRRIICKGEVSDQGENLRFIVTSFESSQPSFLYDTIYCARGQMENHIKNHKTFLHSDRTSCHSFMANQFRLFLHSAAYVLLHTLAEQGLGGTKWARAQFNTLQNRIIKAGARVHELVTKIKFHFPTSFPLKDLFVTILRNLAHAFP